MDLAEIQKRWECYPICQSKTDVEWLISRCRELEAENARLRGAIEKHRKLVGTYHSLPDDFLYAVLDTVVTK